MGLSWAARGGVGVWGATKNGKAAVVGHDDGDSGVGVLAETKGGDGVGGIVYSGNGAAIHGIKQGTGGLAGLFEGDVDITGDLRLRNADCAEDFDFADANSVEPGTVVVLNDDGQLQANTHAYDKRVVGVISGAGSYKPGIVLDKQSAAGSRLPVALLGKVFCKVDARLAPINVGDLLTTSATSGCAMKATDPALAFGSIIGKALRPHAAGVGLIPILVALQ